MNNIRFFKRSLSAHISNPLITILLILAGYASLARADTGPAPLIKAYYSYLLLENSNQQTTKFVQPFSQELQKEVQNSNQIWMDDSLNAIRQGLTQQVGANSKQAFQEFVTTYTLAEQNDDLAYLAVLANDLGMDDPPESYVAFKNRYTNQHLDDQIQYCAMYISEVQTWLDVQNKYPDAPTLQAWLNKDRAPRTAPEETTPANSLAHAEAPLPEFQELDAKDELNPMDAFSQMHDKRRKRVAKQAQAGMAQVAAERAAAESAYADKKATGARAEADAVAAQARKLATAEADALSQRQNSWSARLKKIASGTISGVVGAFTGGIGAEAGVRAADAVFNNN